MSRIGNVLPCYVGHLEVSWLVDWDGCWWWREVLGKGQGKGRVELDRERWMIMLGGRGRGVGHADGDDETCRESWGWGG